MRYWIVLVIAAGFLSCTGGEQRSESPDTNRQAKDSTIGVDSTRIGTDSGILRKLP